MMRAILSVMLVVTATRPTVALSDSQLFAAYCFGVKELQIEDQKKIINRETNAEVKETLSSVVTKERKILDKLKRYLLSATKTNKNDFISASRAQKAGQTDIVLLNNSTANCRNNCPLNTNEDCFLLCINKDKHIAARGGAIDRSPGLQVCNSVRLPRDTQRLLDRLSGVRNPDEAAHLSGVMRPALPK
jgi:hypothetical protein